jgi:hypothetical protein
MPVAELVQFNEDLLFSLRQPVRAGSKRSEERANRTRTGCYCSKLCPCLFRNHGSSCQAGRRWLTPTNGSVYGLELPSGPRRLLDN